MICLVDVGQRPWRVGEAGGAYEGLVGDKRGFGDHQVSEPRADRFHGEIELETP